MRSAKGAAAISFRYLAYTSSCAAPIGGANPLHKKIVQLQIILGNTSAGGLGQFVIANEKMDLRGILTFERGDKVEKLMRAVAAGRIPMRPVDRLL